MSHNIRNKKRRTSCECDEAGGCVVISKWGKKGNKNGQLQFPQGIAVGNNGRVYVSDSENHRLQCFEADGTFVRKWGRQGRANGEFGYPSGLFVWKADKVAEAMHAVSSIAALPPGLFPLCVAYVGDECIGAVDTHNHRVQVFETDGKFIRKWGNFGHGDGQFNEPAGGETDENGMIYVSDTLNHRIQMFDIEGTFIRKWGGYGELNCPRGVGVGRGGVVYVADSKNNRIVQYRPDGTLICSYAPFMCPNRVLVDDEDDSILYVCDSGYHNVCRYRVKEDRVVRRWGDFGSNHGKFDWPNAVAKATDGLLYIADKYNHRIVCINSRIL